LFQNFIKKAFKFQTNKLVRKERGGAFWQQQQLELLQNADLSIRRFIWFYNRSEMWKGGFDRNETPRFVFLSIVGRPKYKNTMAGSTNKDAFVDLQLRSCEGHLLDAGDGITHTVPIYEGYSRSPPTPT
jgi:actin-related protein